MKCGPRRWVGHANLGRHQLAPQRQVFHRPACQRRAPGPDPGGRAPVAVLAQHPALGLRPRHRPKQLAELSAVWVGGGHVAGSAATIALIVGGEPGGRTPGVQFDLGQATMSIMLAAADLGIGSGHSAVRRPGPSPASARAARRKGMRVPDLAWLPGGPSAGADQASGPPPVRPRSCTAAAGKQFTGAAATGLYSPSQVTPTKIICGARAHTCRVLRSGHETGGVAWPAGAASPSRLARPRHLVGDVAGGRGTSTEPQARTPEHRGSRRYTAPTGTGGTQSYEATHAIGGERAYRVGSPV